LNRYKVGVAMGGGDAVLLGGDEKIGGGEAIEDVDGRPSRVDLEDEATFGLSPEKAKGLVSR
jgi:hypothetical protein